ncbi:dihydrokaempferol 4-reductase [Aureococcus anophagefferens]|nr:dihydrokaempferol 4-reductase [Aureococcus anophagefferens]
MVACSIGQTTAEFEETLRDSLQEAFAVKHQEAMKLPVLSEAALEQPAVPSLPERPVEAPAPGPKKARVHVATPLEREIKDVLGKGCSICGESSAKLLCVCKTSRYCSVQCQRVDWSQRPPVGVPQDPRARQRGAQDLGHAKAKANLAMMYELSGPGQDLVEARRLYESAAAKGYAPAQNALSQLDSQGLG